MKRLNANSKAAGKSANEFKHIHHWVISQALQIEADGVFKGWYEAIGISPYRIAFLTKYVQHDGEDCTLEPAQVFRRLSEMVAAAIVEVTDTAGKTPSGRKCQQYRLVNKSK